MPAGAGKEVDESTKSELKQNSVGYKTKTMNSEMRKYPDELRETVEFGNNSLDSSLLVTPFTSHICGCLSHVKVFLVQL